MLITFDNPLLAIIANSDMQRSLDYNQKALLVRGARSLIDLNSSCYLAMVASSD